MHEKEIKLRNIIEGYGSLALAWSGGVDSTYLAAFAHEVLGDKVLLLNARSASFAEDEANFVEKFAKARGIPFKVVETHELNIKEYAENPPNRCFFCKTEMYGTLKPIAEKAGVRIFADGANIDDFKDFRPGHKAAEDHDIKHPLKDAGMNKQDIRRFSKEMDLPTWDKPAFACLASRFPYGEHLDEAKLRRVDKAEQVLRSLGFSKFRVRSHETLARIEFAEEEIEIGFEKRKIISDELKKLEYDWVSIDLDGFRSGSMNVVLKSLNHKQNGI